MHVSQYFDIRRFWLLLKLELTRSKKGILLTLVITFGMLFFVGMLLDLIVTPARASFEHDESYAFSLIISGFILSSLAFSDLSSGLKRIRYLTLPVSTFERLFCMWLLTSLGWVGLYTVVYTLYTMVANVIGSLIFGAVSFEPFRPFSAFAINSMTAYLVLQGIFLVGAVWFRGYVLAKTLFVLIIFATLIGATGYFTLKDAFLTEHRCVGTECEILDVITLHPVWTVAKGLFWWVLAPVLWIIAYLGLREQEV